MKEHLCVDEQMVPFKKTSWLKQFIPKKPHKWGYKFFLLCDSSGVVYDFIIYTGKIDPVDKAGVPDLGTSSNSVLHLAQSIPHHQNHKLFFDNWFTSVPLISYLAKQGIWCCGTVQARQSPGLRFKTDKELKREGRGSKDVWKADVDIITVAAVKWQDTHSVCAASTFLSHKPEGTCKRYKKHNRCIEAKFRNCVQRKHGRCRSPRSNDCALSDGIQVQKVLSANDISSLRHGSGELLVLVPEMLIT